MLPMKSSQHCNAPIKFQMFKLTHLVPNKISPNKKQLLGIPQVLFDSTSHSGDSKTHDHDQMPKCIKVSFLCLYSEILLLTL